jgi:hypothetical protein
MSLISQTLRRATPQSFVSITVGAKIDSQGLEEMAALRDAAKRLSLSFKPKEGHSLLIYFN